MRLKIPKDYFNNPIPPRLFLCNTGGKRIGELSAYDTSLVAKWNSYSELNFSIDRQYVDILTGELKVNPLFDKAEGLRQVEVENMGMFIIQDPDTNYSDKDSKSLSCFSLEYATASKYANNFYCNNGAIDSIEVTYEVSKYGADATKDDMYKMARYDGYDASEKYYHRVYYDSRNYDYEQIQIADEAAYQTHFGTDISIENVLYIHGYENVQFFNKYTPELSLLHNIFSYIPEWSIGYVDYALWHKERRIEEERISIYDLLTNKVADIFECVVIWNTLEHTVDFRVEENDGLTDDDVINSDWETDVYISRKNLATNLNIKYSADDIKTKLKVSGADDLSIREVNLGKNYIMNLSFYHNPDWMEQDLFEAYNNYLDAVEENKGLYEVAFQGWVTANNKYNELQNAIPAEGNVVLVGDEFKKLYCIYGLYQHVTEFQPQNTPIYYIMLDDGSMQVANPQPTASTFADGVYYIKGDKTTKETELNKKLTLYHVNEDIDANKTDNILLRVKNSDNDVAVIRVYNASTAATEQAKKDNPDYKIQVVITRAASGISEAPFTRTLSNWIDGDLRTTKEGISGLKDLAGFKVIYIGTMGAYFVLTKDEREPDNIKDYGVELLKTKHEVYTKIFQTQTEAMFSQEKYRCIVSDTQPVGVYDDGTRWLDSDSNPLKLYQYDSSIVGANKWVQISSDVPKEDQENYENYQRYIDNYDKLRTIQAVLSSKEREAQYYRDGYVASDIRINVDDYDPTTHLNPQGQSLESVMERVARTHFIDYTVVRVSMDYTFPLYTFTTSYMPGTNFSVYLKGTVPYVACTISRGACQMKMDYYSNLTELNNFFTEDQWARLSPFIREDEYSNDTVLLNGLESEEERSSIYKELIALAAKELQTLSQPSLEFSMDMANILAIPEFEPLMSQFALGNFIRIELRERLIKRSRLLEVNLNFDDFSDFNCTFGNLVTTKDEIDKHTELLAQAVQAGKQVATSAGEWQKGTEKANKLEDRINNGLQDVNLQIRNASGQVIEIGQNGLIGRKLIDGTTDTYDDEQVALINNKLCFTADGWRSSKSAFGKFTIQDENGNDVTHWGILSDAVVSGYISGSVIEGGSLKIGGDGGTFLVNPDGSVQILTSDGKNAYATSAIQDAMEFSTRLEYENQTIFSDQSDTCTITCKVYHLNDDITTDVLSQSGSSFTWSGYTGTPTTYPGQPNKITINHTNVSRHGEISCQIQFDDSPWIENN